jgi:hypothetical protein
MVAMIYQSETYISCSFLLKIVPKTLTANITQRITIAISIGHSNSAYSRFWVYPIKSDQVARAIPTLKSHR